MDSDVLGNTTHDTAATASHQETHASGGSLSSPLQLSTLSSHALPSDGTGAAPERPSDFANKSTVQLDGKGDGTDAVHASAAHGVSGPGSALPHAQKIQASFGSFDISGIKAHTDSRAATSTKAMGANAFASGHDVAFAPGKADLHTAAHEAAHVIQQSAGVQLSGGVGAVGDRYERHADAVADRVVAGESAEDLLGSMAGAPSTQLKASATTSVQLKTSWTALSGLNDWRGGKLLQKSGYHISMVKDDADANAFKEFHVTNEAGSGSGAHFFFSENGVHLSRVTNAHGSNDRIKDQEDWPDLLAEAQRRATSFVAEVRKANKVADWGDTKKVQFQGRFNKNNTQENVLAALSGEGIRLDDTDVVPTVKRGSKSGNRHYWWEVEYAFDEAADAMEFYESARVTADPWKSKSAK